MLARFLSPLALAACFLVSPACLGSGNSVNAYGGVRTLDSDDFDGLDDQVVYGLDAVLKLDLPLLAVEGGWFHAEEEDDAGGLTDAELASDEYFVGLRVVPWPWLIEPYASIGATWIDTELDATGVGDDDGSIAYYARVGAAIEVAIFRIGLDGRGLFGSDVDLETIESDVDSYQLTAFIGIGF